MVVLRNKDVRKMDPKDVDKRLGELKLELAKEKANISVGASATSPGKIKEIRKAIARIETARSVKTSRRKGKE